jgi:hypothetical protein
MDLEETIFFYSRNNYLIINNLLCGNMDHLWEVAELSNDDSKGVLKEHADGLRKLDQKSIERYRNRIYKKLDDVEKARILKIAREDITNIIGAMKPAKSEMLLYRTIWYARAGDILPQHKANDVVEFKIISSTSTLPFMENAGHEFYRYEITVPPGGFVLELDQFDPFIRNEDGEVLLPPMKCKVKNVRVSDNEKCRAVIELEYLERMPASI